MATVEHPPIYEELLDLLAKYAEPREVLAFQLSERQQQQLDELLSKSRDGIISPEESAELDTFEQFEHVVRLLKTRVRGKQQP